MRRCLLVLATLAVAQLPLTSSSLWMSSPIAGRSSHVDSTSGHVTVVGLLSAGFSYSRRHAVQLDKLRQKLEGEGLPVVMLGINAHHRASQLMVSQFDNLINFSIYQSTPDNQLWGKLGGMKDDVFIYDDCGRLTYYLPFPHSFVPSRFVELAIRSTFTNAICGPKNETMSVVNIKLLREPHIRPETQHRSVEHRKCSCLSGSRHTSGEQHCLCRIRSGQTYETQGSSNDACFCKWTTDEVESKCHCHRGANDVRSCDCRLGPGQNLLSNQSCYWQTSPLPYASFASENGVRQNVFWSRHAQPLLWQDAMRMWPWPSGDEQQLSVVRLEGQEVRRSDWSWEGQDGGSLWRWPHHTMWQWGTAENSNVWLWGRERGWGQGGQWGTGLWEWVKMWVSREWLRQTWGSRESAMWSGKIWNNADWSWGSNSSLGEWSETGGQWMWLGNGRNSSKDRSKRDAGFRPPPRRKPGGWKAPY